jgi:hypothetical protein
MSENKTVAEAQENEVVKEQTQGTKAEGVYVHTFKKPFKYEDNTYTNISFNFDGLKGKDMIAIENEMTGQNEIVFAPEISASFLCRMAARAGGIGSDAIEAMPIGDFSKIKNAARNFLISTGY